MPSISVSNEGSGSGAVHGTRVVLGAVSMVAVLKVSPKELSIVSTTGGTVSTTVGASSAESGVSYRSRLLLL